MKMPLSFMISCFLMIAATAQDTCLPVTKVTIFSSGVSYFEHTGQLRGNGTVTLKFRKDQMDDVLKSLVVLDKEGQPAAVHYASQEPIARALKGLGIDISDNPTLAQLMRRLRGAAVTVSVGATPVEGRIVSVEKKKRHIPADNAIIEEDIINIHTEKGLKSFPIGELSCITLKNEKLNEELSSAMELLVRHRDTDRKPVEISFSGKGEREVLVGYINESPVWKTSYRVVLEDTGKSLLQGWAIVENTSETDWADVQLTLVSGRPISFVQDLYTPLFRERPRVEPELYQFLKPQIYDDGIAEKPAALPMEMQRRERAPRAAAAPRLMMSDALMETEERPADRFAAKEFVRQMADIEAAAHTSETGELFAYKIATPVNLERRNSALFPIVNQNLPVRKISIYNASVLQRHPLNGFRLDNETGMSLLAGPVTVFEDGIYAGDAQLGDLAPGDQRFLSYGIDLKTRVDSSARQETSVVSGKINRGILEIGRRREFKQDYAINNKDDTKRALLIEHPRDHSRKLVKPEKASERTEQILRFDVEVPANETKTFTVIEERVDMQSIAILPADINTLTIYVRTGEIPRNVRDAIAEAIARKTALLEAERSLAQIQENIKELRADQDNTRKNMTAVTRNTPAYTRFEQKLLELETNFEGLQRQLHEKRQEIEKLRKALEDYVSNLNIG